MINWTSFETNCKRVEAQFKALYESSINLRGLDRSPYSKAHKKVYDSNIQILKQCIEYANKIAENEEEDLPFSEYVVPTTNIAETKKNNDSNNNNLFELPPVKALTAEEQTQITFNMLEFITQSFLRLGTAAGYKLSPLGTLSKHIDLQTTGSAISTAEQTLINHVLGQLSSYYKGYNQQHIYAKYYSKPTFRTVAEMQRYNLDHSNIDYTGQTHIDEELLSYIRTNSSSDNLPLFDDINYPEIASLLQQNNKTIENIFKNFKYELKHLPSTSTSNESKAKEITKEQSANKELRSNLKSTLAQVRATVLDNAQYPNIIKTIFCRIEEWYNLRYSINLVQSGYLFSLPKLKENLECICWLYGSLFDYPEYTNNADKYNNSQDHITSANLLFRKLIALRYNFDVWARHIDNEQDSMRTLQGVSYLAYAFSTVTPIDKIFKDKATDTSGNYTIKDMSELFDTTQVYPTYIDSQHSIGFAYCGTIYKRTPMALWLLYTLYSLGVPGISLKHSDTAASIADMSTALVLASLQDPEVIKIGQELNRAIENEDVVQIDTIMNSIFEQARDLQFADDEDESLSMDDIYNSFMSCDTPTQLYEYAAYDMKNDFTHGQIFSPYMNMYSEYLWRYYAKSILRPQYIVAHDVLKRRMLYPNKMIYSNIIQFVTDKNTLNLFLQDSELDSDKIQKWIDEGTPNDYQHYKGARD